MIKLIDKQKIILEHRAGKSNRQIAADLGIDKNTVNKYVTEFEVEMQRAIEEGSSRDSLPPSIIAPPKYDTSNRGPRKSTEEAEKVIRECLDENERKRNTGRSKMQMKKTDIHRYLHEQGYDISYSTVKRVVRSMENETRHQEAFIKQEYSPGMAVEFDWGEVKLNIGETGLDRYQMAVFSSSYCNFRFAKLYRSQDTASFMDSHVSFFQSVHGIFHTVVYDNMKVAVKKFVGPTEKEPTDSLLSMSSYYGFNFRFCNVRRGNEKGHVERSVDRVRRFAFSAPDTDCFDTLEAANEYLADKCAKLNSRPLSDGKIPGQLFNDEKKMLLPELPPMPCFSKKCGLHVDKYSTVSIIGVHYSVPDTMVGRKVDARVYTDRIELYEAGTDKLVARHGRCFRDGAYKLDIFHYLRTMKRKPGALPQSCALMQADVLVKKTYEKYFSTCPKDFLEVLEFMRDVGVEKAYGLIEELAASHDISIDKLRQLYHNRQTDEKRTPPCSDRLSVRSKQSLGEYDILRKLQSTRTKEAV